MARGTPKRNFRCEDDLWIRFVEACEEAGTDASTQIRTLMAGWVKRRGKKEVTGD